jgi:uncharacterized protein involved in cysteine biosynthesis
LFFGSLAAIDPARARSLEGEAGLPFKEAAGIAVRRLLRLVGFTLLALLLSLVPVLGWLLGPALGLSNAARFLAWELLEPWLTKRGMRYVEQRAFLRAHRATLLGFALPALGLLAIPLAGPFLFALLQAAAAHLVPVVEGEETPGGVTR